MSDILSIGSSGINAYRQLLEVTGNNIVNANTAGYVRRDVELSVLGAGGGTTTAQNNTGNGVIVDMVTRASDPILQSQTLNATSESQMQQTLSQGLTQLETSIANPSTNINTAASSFYNSLQSLAASPTSIPARQTVISTGQQLASEFNSQANYLTTEITTGFNAIQSGLTEVNTLTTQLAKVNLNISQSSTGNQQPNDLLDQRDQLLSQLSQLVGINVTANTNGEVQVRLGNDSGPLLVDGSQSKDLSAVNQNNQVSIIYDRSGFNMPTNQLTSGSIAGLLNYNSQALITLQSFDQMAGAFAQQMNSQNQQGIDLNGNAGQAMFSTSALMATASATNQGNATLNITSSAPVDPSKSYSAQFNAQTNQWTVTSNTTNEYVTGTNNLSLDGQTFTFSGTPANSDSFSITQNPSAASNIRFILSDPATIAASASHFSDALATNKGSATLAINSTNETITPTPQPLLQNIFSQSQSAADALGIKQNGLVASIPAGTENISLSSLQGISSATFPISDKLVQPNMNLSLTANISTNGVAHNYTFTTPLSVATPPNLNNLASSINNAFNSDSQLKGQLYASVSNGTLTINALGSTQIVSNQATPTSLTDSNHNLISLANVQTPTTAGNLEVFTREGVQLAGPLLSLDQQQKLMTTANGFLPTAVYKAPNSLSINGQQADISALSPKAFNLSYSNNGQNGSLAVTLTSGNLADIASQINAQINTNSALQGNMLAEVENGTLVINSASQLSLTSANITGTPSTASITTLGAAATQNTAAISEVQTLSLTQEPTAGTYVISIPKIGGGIDNQVINLKTGSSAELANAIQSACGTQDQINCQASNTGSGVVVTYQGNGGISTPITLAPALNSTLDETNNYRNTQITTLSSPLNVTNINNTAQINITSFAGTDSALGADAGNSQAGGAYVLNIAGLPQVTFAGDQIANLTSDQLTSKITSTLNQLGSTHSVSGSALSLNSPTNPLQLNFTVMVNGVANNVQFNQSPILDGNGQLMNDGSLTVSGPSGLIANVTKGNDGQQHLTFSLPQALSNPSPSISFAGDPSSLSALGLNGSSPVYALEGGAQTQLPSSSMSPSNYPLTITETINGTTTSRSINVALSSDGSVNILQGNNNQPDPNVQGYLDTNGHLILTDNAGQLSITPQTIADRDNAAQLGFLGSDLSLTQTSSGLNITSTLNQTNLASTSGSVSRIAQNITIGSAPEDLLVTMTGLAAGQSGQVLSQYTAPPQNATQTAPNITVKILSPATNTSQGTIEIIDNASNSVLATRNYLPNQPITYMDTSFQINGDAAEGDAFTLVKDTSRSGDNQNALLLAGLQQKALSNTTSGTFSDVYNTTMSNLGAASQSASTASTTASTLLSGLQNAYDALTGVDMDTEAANLMRYQQDYSASAQVIQTAKTMFDAIQSIVSTA